MSDKGSHQNSVLTYIAPGRAELRPSPPATAPGSDQARVRTLFSAISRGTERLVFHGRIPASQHDRMRAPAQRGDFPFPVAYGYAAVGEVIDGPTEWRGRRVFALHPHERFFTAPIAALSLLPESADPRRATLAANMETALNALWDAGFGPGDRVAVVGGGVLGLLVAGLVAATPGSECVLVDPDRSRAEIAEAFGARFEPAWAEEAAAAGAEFQADIVFHTSATEAGLRAALVLAGTESVVAELSWYGDAAPAVPLGEAFHSRRLRLLSSQVGAVAAPRRPRWSHARRLAKAIELLADPRYEALITAEIPFEQAPERLSDIFAPRATGLATVLRY